ncbi:MAG: hypothetical protein FJX36_10775 [Alphaproteobacteria bacterium]|nr:hypothetical protein [Alphaproteobacteria bacterium]
MALQAFGHRRELEVEQPAARPRHAAVEDMLGDEAQRDKGHDQQRQPDQAAFLELQLRDDRGALQLGGQGENRRRHARQVRARRFDVGRQRLGCARRLGGGWRGDSVARQPVLHHGVGQKLQHLAHFGRRVGVRRPAG